MACQQAAFIFDLTAEFVTSPSNCRLSSIDFFLDDAVVFLCILLIMRYNSRDHHDFFCCCCREIDDSPYSRESGDVSRRCHATYWSHCKFTPGEKLRRPHHPIEGTIALVSQLEIYQNHGLAFLFKKLHELLWKVHFAVVISFLPPEGKVLDWPGGTY